MTESLYTSADKEPPVTLDPALNAPLVAYLASERASHVNGQIFGRTSTPKPLTSKPAWGSSSPSCSPASRGPTRISVLPTRDSRHR